MLYNILRDEDFVLFYSINQKALQHFWSQNLFVKIDGFNHILHFERFEFLFHFSLFLIRLPNSQIFQKQFEIFRINGLAQFWLSVEFFKVFFVLILSVICSTRFHFFSRRHFFNFVIFLLEFAYFLNLLDILLYFP